MDNDPNKDDLWDDPEYCEAVALAESIQEDWPEWLLGHEGILEKLLDACLEKVAADNELLNAP